MKSQVTIESKPKQKSDKELKKDFKKIASKDPNKFYATTVLKKEGFHRSNCDSCDLFFWSTDKNRKICGDSACIGEFQVANQNNKATEKTNKTNKSKDKSKEKSNNSLSYIDVWNTFKAHMQKRGYQAIKRYPVVARWNPTVDFTIASIAAFQPFVISGQVDPPAKKLTIPQFCLRFGDVDNVGITGSHCTGLVMIGQHQFVSKANWDQDQAFQDIYDYVTKVVKAPKEELILHEDAWAGGGNFGPCMEFFSKGLELFNQVYMMYEQTADGKTQELKIKVLDMGLGMERIAWFSQGTANLYEAIFPKTLKKFRQKIDLDYDLELFSKFSVYSGSLNVDETDNINLAWKNIANKLNFKDPAKLKEKILPVAAAYSVIEHTRALLVAINDGALPSNVGGGYNLRMILRRSLSFIDKFNWDISLSEIATWHAQEMFDFYPELKQNLKDTLKIFEVEIEKYHLSKQKAKAFLKKTNLNSITTKNLIDLYDSQGITPQLVQEHAKNQGIDIKIPNNFYQLVSNKHEKTTTTSANQSTKQSTKQAKKSQESQKPQKTVFPKSFISKLESLPDTKIMYYPDWSKTKFKAKVLLRQDQFLILDQTYFYPSSGGQDHDNGTIEGIEVSSLFKLGKITIHELSQQDKTENTKNTNISGIKTGDTVSCEIDFSRRKQLTQHHSSAHIVNAAARTILGPHINQAGANKKLDRAHLDITHFASLTKEQEQKIQTLANKIIKQKIPINKFFMPRVKAELKYGVGIYQGGVAPGKDLRIVEIEGVDVEACGGTHLNNSSEAEQILITQSNKISDAVVRIHYLAGDAAKNFGQKEAELISDLCKFFKITKSKSSLLPAYALALFTAWKKGKKALKKKKPFIFKLQLDLTDSKQSSKQDLKQDSKQIVEELIKILGTQKEHLLKTLNRFQTEAINFEKKANSK